MEACKDAVPHQRPSFEGMWWLLYGIGLETGVISNGVTAKEREEVKKEVRDGLINVSVT